MQKLEYKVKDEEMPLLRHETIIVIINIQQLL